jgi:crossover junction endodeoxyribonuclease RusA
LIPFEFVVEGTPKSQQAEASSKKKWRLKVLNEAIALWIVGDQATSTNVQVTVTYFYEGKESKILDVDNMLKPILDALNGLVYIDDKQVTDVIGKKRDINGTFNLQNASPLLRTSLTKGIEFVYVQIQIAPDPRSL